jgi:hypothetical protein
MSAHTCEQDENFAEDCAACMAALSAEVARQRALYHPNLRPLEPHERVWRSREDHIREQERLDG